MNPAVRLLFALPAILLIACIAWLVGRGGIDRGARGAMLPSVEEGVDFPRSVKLPEGGTLTIERPPERVLLANASAVDMVTMLVGPERLAAIPAQSFEYSRLADEAGAFADVATFDAVEAEVILSFDPDLVVVDPWAAAETIARLREIGVPVLSLPQVVAIDDVLNSIRILGRVLGADEEADTVLTDLRERIAVLRAAAPARAKLRSVSYTNSGAGGWSAGKGTTNHELITLAGLTNAAAEAGRTDHVRTSFEDLHAMDPDFLLVGDFRPGMEAGASARFLRTEPALADLRAVREDRILLVPSRLFAASSQEVVLGAELLAAEVDRWLEEQADSDGAGR